MLSILGALLGFFSSSLPTIFGYFQDKIDKSHELDMLEMQMKWAQVQVEAKEIETKMSNDMTQTAEAYQNDKTSAIKWVQALNGCMRPILAISFLTIYLMTKLSLIHMQVHHGVIFDNLWTDIDATLLACIVAYFFGSNALEKMAGKL